MKETQKGKIGGRPKAVQEQVNRRREKGRKGWPLVAWFNAWSEVPAVQAANLAGTLLSPPFLEIRVATGCTQSKNRQRLILTVAAN